MSVGGYSLYGVVANGVPRVQLLTSVNPTLNQGLGLQGPCRTPSINLQLGHVWDPFGPGLRPIVIEAVVDRQA